MALSPCEVNSQCEGSRLAVRNRAFPFGTRAAIESGTFCPAYFCNAGFGSNESTWLTPPPICKTIMLLAGPPTANRISGPFPSAAHRLPSAIDPRPRPERRSISRRETGASGTRPHGKMEVGFIVDRQIRSGSARHDRSEPAERLRRSPCTIVRPIVVPFHPVDDLVPVHTPD